MDWNSLFIKKNPKQYTFLCPHICSSGLICQAVDQTSLGKLRNSGIGDSFSPAWTY